LKTELGKLESMKTSAVTAKLKGEDKIKTEAEIQATVTKITDLEAKVTQADAALIDQKQKIKDM